ncbi:hypothetical protein SPBR_08714 [Sporothrix brasiliensis 5110]|uniref:Uncharacterized protein n=1 Tax=Sporothrix brasiliensis 5110 TaxID=1398154 RepID=A0A0C2IMT6_9PEZI|nr:uncharacterized protein SPBR_08714 [Sporothrix brasiliensis 5110]KIH86302.1 hypothetical protein SPBR_08714 [Sporothrix brasiliensis 5110]
MSGRIVELSERAEGTSRLETLEPEGSDATAALCFKRPPLDFESLGGDCGCEVNDDVLTLLLTELENAELEFRVRDGELVEDASSNDCLGLSSKLVTARMVDRVRERPPEAKPPFRWDGTAEDAGDSDSDGDDRAIAVIAGTDGNGLSPRVEPLELRRMAVSPASASGISVGDVGDQYVET